MKRWLLVALEFIANPQRFLMYRRANREWEATKKLVAEKRKLKESK